MATHKLCIKRVFSEIKYPVQVDLLDIKSKVLKAFWPKEFGHWRLENNINLRFLDCENPAESKRFLFITPKQFIFSVEDPNTDSYFIDKYRKLYNSFAKVIALNDEPLIRVGLRCYAYLQGAGFDQVVALCNKNAVFDRQLLDAIGGTNYTFADFSVTIEKPGSRIVFGPDEKG